MTDQTVQQEDQESLAAITIKQRMQELLSMCGGSYDLNAMATHFMGEEVLTQGDLTLGQWQHRIEKAIMHIVQNEPNTPVAFEPYPEQETDDFETLSDRLPMGRIILREPPAQPINCLPCSTPEFEWGLWGAMVEAPGRDWDETEREYLRRNQGIREAIVDWVVTSDIEGACTQSNRQFLQPYAGGLL